MDIVLTPLTVVAISSLIIPLVTGLVTKNVASEKLKASIALVLSLIGGAFATAVQPDGTAILSQALIVNTVITTATQLAMYLGVYKPVVKINDKLAPDKGLG